MIAVSVRRDRIGHMGAFLVRHSLLFILLMAWLVRVTAAVGVQHVLDHRLHRAFVIEGDAAGYWELGRALATGGGYALYDPPRRVLRMPGFPTVLAVGMKLADLVGLANWAFLINRLLLAGVGTFACWLVYRLGRELADETVGLVAAAYTAIAPTLVGFSVLILSETLFAAAITLNLLLMAKLVRTGREPTARRRGLWLAAANGVAFAAAVYVRPSWILAAPLFALGLILAGRFRRPALLRAAVVIAAMLLALFPWAARNRLVTGHWVWTTLWSGPSLYDGLNPHATGDSEMSFFDRDRLMERMSEYEVDEHYRRKAWQFVRENPGRTFELALIKLARYWSPVPNAAQFDHWSLKVLVAAFYLPLMLLAVYGAWRSRADIWLVALTAGPILYFAAIHAVFVASLRYRLPAEYPLAVLAAVGVSLVLPHVRKQPTIASS